MIKKIQKELELRYEKIKSYDLKITDLNENYKRTYQNSLTEKEYLLNNNESIMELNRIKKVSITMLLLILSTFIIAIVRNSMIIYCVFGVLCFMLVFTVGKYFVTIRTIAKNNEKNLRKYIKITGSLSLVNEKREKVLFDKLDEERKIKKMENDLRFYNNLIKYK